MVPAARTAVRTGRTGPLLRRAGASAIVLATLGPRPRAVRRARALSRSLAVCAALVTLAVMTLWPARGFAAILPACEGDFESQAAVPADAVPEDAGSCEVLAARGDDIDNSRVAPICDLSGASAIAPPRIRGVPDIRFERGRSCEGSEEARAAVSPSRGDPPAQPTDTTFERVILPSLDDLGPRGEPCLIDPLAPTSGPREGVRDSIYHPPR